MSNPCECCQGKIKFIRKISGNYIHSMVMPECFLNYFDGKIPGTVKLEAPNGNTYGVGVAENVNRAILKSGWAAFIGANQIEENYSLMFRYLGNARFEVTIFDSNDKEKALRCGGMKAASDVQTPNSRYVDNSSSSHDGYAKSSSGEGSDSHGGPNESSYRQPVNTPALSYNSEEFSEDNPSADESLELDDLQILPKDCILSGRCDLTVGQKVQIRALIAEIQPKIPVFVVLVKKTNVGPCTTVVIRKDYALAFLPCESQTITLQVPRNSFEWQCSLYIRPDGGRNLHLGRNFVRDNHVQEGDVCIFQPMSKVKARRFMVVVHVLHKLSIGHSPGGRTGIVPSHRRTTSTKVASTVHVKEEPTTDGEEISSSGYEDDGCSDNSEGASEPPFILPDGTHLTQAQEKKVLEKVSAIESEQPIYVAVMNKTSVRHQGPYLSFGMRYVSRCLENKCTTGHHGKRSVISLVLQREGKIRTWDTELRRRGDRIHSMILCKGWSSFSRINSLREGDICLFKLMENEEPLKMMVYIIRRKKC